jgi:hypothetical protein
MIVRCALFDRLQDSGYPGASSAGFREAPDDMRIDLNRMIPSPIWMRGLKANVG